MGTGFTGTDYNYKIWLLCMILSLCLYLRYIKLGMWIICIKINYCSILHTFRLKLSYTNICVYLVMDILLVRWQGCKGLSIYWNNRSEETIRSCGGYREVVLVVITSLPKKLFSLTLAIASGFCLHRNNPSYYCPSMDV